MRKLISITLILITILSLLCSCGIKKTPALESESVPETAPETTSPDDFDPNDDKFPLIYGDKKECRVHNKDYHSFNNKHLINYVGERRFNQWLKSAQAVTRNYDCPYPEANLYTFVRAFDISREELEKLYLTSNSYNTNFWNIDLLYSNNEKSYDEFYRNSEMLDDVSKKRSFIANLKVLIRQEHYDKFTEKFDSDFTLYSQTSVRRIVEKLNIPREDLEDYANRALRDYAEDLEYDFNAIYNEDGSVKTEATDAPFYEEDMIFCGLEIESLNEIENTPDTNNSSETEPIIDNCTNSCLVHDYASYHNPWSYETIIFRNAGYEEWSHKERDTESATLTVCPWPDHNIYSCIKELNIPREEFEESYFNSTNYYYLILNFDLLYSDDEESVEQFYRNKNRIELIRDKRLALKDLKIKLRDAYPKEYEDAFGKNGYEDDNITPAISIRDIVEVLNMPRGTLEAFAEASGEDNIKKYNYNFDAIYNSDGSVKPGTDDADSYVKEDAEFCRINDIYSE